MDHLWSPWRYRYVTRSGASEGCLFCVKSTEHRDQENLVVFRGVHSFVLLNLYPYTSGHVMIAPYEHVPVLEEASPEALMEMTGLLRRTAQILRKLYKPDGMNIGMNIGECAGAGVAGHIHMHVLPRWCGDTNFMTTVGETRVLPEELSVTWQRLRREFEEPPPDQVATFGRSS
jgi:Diadenosine tetraphosphate (Ap4A) hydrolase and other HIT family hydrolases